VSATAVAWGLVLASCLVTFMGMPEVGLFLAFSAAVLAILAAVQPGEARRDAHRRNHARRR
jgi:hypothetical protein